ncbi:MAG: HlyD family efflux transporter periplasmic adaptor subunit, partial [Rhodothermales bacterium]
LDTLFLRAYVSGDQLATLEMGREVEVIVDGGPGDLQTLPGTITWIAADAEFTPKLIQTREERVNLVYAIKVRVPNSGGIAKIGMPGEVRF